MRNPQQEEVLHCTVNPKKMRIFDLGHMHCSLKDCSYSVKCIDSLVDTMCSNENVARDALIIKIIHEIFSDYLQNRRGLKSFSCLQYMRLATICTEPI